MRKSKWQQVGEVCIDTGTLFLGDPITMDHHDVMQSVSDFINEDTHQIKRDGRNWCVWTRTGFGDGYYPVEIRMDGDRVAEVRVRFL